MAGDLFIPVHFYFYFWSHQPPVDRVRAQLHCECCYCCSSLLCAGALYATHQVPDMPCMRLLALLYARTSVQVVVRFAEFTTHLPPLNQAVADPCCNFRQFFFPLLFFPIKHVFVCVCVCFFLFFPFWTPS